MRVGGGVDRLSGNHLCFGVSDLGECRGGQILLVGDESRDDAGGDGGRVVTGGKLGRLARDGVPGEFGLGVPGAGIHDADALPTQLAGGHRVEGGESGLDGGVRAESCGGVLADDAAEGDDERRSAVLLRQRERRHGRTQHAHGGEGVDRPELVEGGVAGLGNGAEGDDAGGVDDTVEPAMRHDGECDEGAGEFGVGEVAGDVRTGDTHLVEGLLRSPRESELGARVGELPCEVPTEPAGSAEDEDRRASQFTHAVTLSAYRGSSRPAVRLVPRWR